MKVTFNKIDSVNATLTIEVAKEDYAPKVKQGLREYGLKADFPGFRKGKVPPALLQKKYGKIVLIDEIEKLASKQLDDYIKENKLHLLGEPLPHAEEQKALDFDNQEDYEFTFDLGLAPEMNAKLTKEDKLPYYTIEVTDEVIDKQINAYKSNYGAYDQADTVEDRDLVKGTLLEINEDGLPKENGICNENATLMPSYIKDEEEKGKFLGAKVGDVVTFNPSKAYEWHEAELSSFLRIKKEEIQEHPGDFTLTLTEITRYKEAEVNQELFDKIYEPGTVNSEEQFKEKIKATIALQLIPESDYKFLIDARKVLENKTKDVLFPEEFLKRWLKESNPGKTQESADEDYTKIIDDLRFHLIREEIYNENKLDVTEAEIRQQAIEVARSQFARYGMPDVPVQSLEYYAQDLLKKKETVQDLFDKVLESKLIEVLKASATLEPQEVSSEEFKKLFEE